MFCGVHYHVTQDEITIVSVKQLTRNQILSCLCSVGWVTILAQLTLQHPQELIEVNQMQEGPGEYLLTCGLLDSIVASNMCAHSATSENVITHLFPL